MTPLVSPDLVAGVELLCLDAGNTVIFLDHARLATIIQETTGRTIAPSALVQSEGVAKRLAETNGLHDVAWSARERPGAASWGKMVGTIALRAGVDEAKVASVLERAWADHEAKNLWSLVPDGLVDALDDARADGVKVAIISNSEGMLERLFRALGLLDRFDLVVDSGLIGVEKPDPRIFGFALDRFGISADRALHLGDVFATDILGARAAGIRCALIDPFGHYEGLHQDVPRIPGAVAVLRALVR